MILIFGLIILYTYYKNNTLLRIKSFKGTKTLGELTTQIRSKTRRKNIKKLLFLEDSKNIISFISNKDNINQVEIYKINSNQELNMCLICECSRYKIDYTIGKKITQNFINSIFADLNFFVNKILFPYLYLMVIFNILQIENQTMDIISSNNEDSNIMWTMSNIHNSTKFSNSNLSTLTSSNYGMVQKDFPHRFTHQNVRLSNWVGSPEIFEECYEIISYQVNNSNYNRLGAVLPKGILLEGPPGVGKTYLAKAIATETNSSFITMSGSEFIEMYVGVGASRVRELFKMARTNSPSIIFIDEIDAIGGKRSGTSSLGGTGGSGGSHREHDQTLNQLLTEMDGFKDNSGIIVLAATNRKDTLDPALLRPGRFDRHIHISLPDKYSREQILKLYLEEKRRKDQGINTTMIAELTDGFSGADLKNLINEAAILAARRGGEKIKSTDLTNAMEKLIVGLVRNRDDRTEESKLRVGIHEVGHGFLTIYFDRYFDLQKISIKSTYNGAGGYTLLNEKIEYSSAGLYTKDLLYKKIIILLGGKAAESLWYGGEQVSLGATQDLKQANQLARKMIELFGMGTDDLETFYNTEQTFGSSHSEKTRELVDNQIISIVSKAYSEAKTILGQHRMICDEIVEMLIRDEILYRKDLDRYYNI
jgi:cell division protease FtsH